MFKFSNFVLHSTRVIIVGSLFFILQGCTTPFVNVEVGSGKVCDKDAEESVTNLLGCNTSSVTTTISHDGLTCQPGSGSHICNPEGAKCNRSGSKVCDTVQVSGDKCGCICTFTPN